MNSLEIVGFILLVLSAFTEVVREEKAIEPEPVYIEPLI